MRTSSVGRLRLIPTVTDLKAEPARRRRRQVVAATLLAGAGLLGRSLSTRPGSRQFYGLTLSVAVTWLAGGLASGPLQLGWSTSRAGVSRRPVAGPVLIGVAAFGAFYGCARVARHVPPLNNAIVDVLSYAHRGSTPMVALTTLVNGAAEEVFFRGALYSAIDEDRQVLLSSAAYAAVTCSTRNPALVLASAVMGVLFAEQRRATGGIQAPMLTHLTWSTLMLMILPPLFRPASGEQTGLA
jgi:uncharacterized protein